MRREIGMFGKATMHRRDLLCVVHSSFFLHYLTLISKTQKQHTRVSSVDIYNRGSRRSFSYIFMITFLLIKRTGRLVQCPINTYPGFT